MRFDKEQMKFEQYAKLKNFPMKAKADGMFPPEGVDVYSGYEGDYDLHLKIRDPDPDSISALNERKIVGDTRAFNYGWPLKPRGGWKPEHSDRHRELFWQVMMVDPDRDVPRGTPIEPLSRERREQLGGLGRPPKYVAYVEFKKGDELSKWWQWWVESIREEQPGYLSDVFEIKPTFLEALSSMKPKVLRKKLLSKLEHP